MAVECGERSRVGGREPEADVAIGADQDHAALRDAGNAPPADPSAMRCPFCESANVVMDSAFGPTQCRSLFYCRGCRQPFEALKSV